MGQAPYTDILCYKAHHIFYNNICKRWSCDNSETIVSNAEARCWRPSKPSSPVLMMEKALADDTEGFEKLNGMNAVHAYVCPAKSALHRDLKMMRQAVARQREELAAAKKEGK